MSYARMGQDSSDVYVYATMNGRYICQWCNIWIGSVDADGGDTTLDSLPELRSHMEAHRIRGHVVPDYVFERIDRESRERRGKG